VEIGVRFAGSKGVREENSARPKRKATTPASSIVEEAVIK